MQDLNKACLFLLVVIIILSPNVLSASFGGLNVVTENRTYYYDNNAPIINVTSLTNNSVISGLSVPFTTNMTDQNGSIICKYRVETIAGSAEVATTTYNCVSTSFNVATARDYRLYINATDGKYDIQSTTDFNTTAVPVTPGGGGGGGDTVNIFGNVTALLLFDTKIIPITVIAPPSKSEKSVIMRNAGNKAITEATIQLSDNLIPYLDVYVCKLDGSECTKTPTIDAGESATLKILGNFPKDFKETQGFIKIIEEQTFQVIVSVEKLPLYQIIDPQVDFLSRWINKSIAVFLVYILDLLIVIIVVRSITKK